MIGMTFKIYVSIFYILLSDYKQWNKTFLKPRYCLLSINYILQSTSIYTTTVCQHSIVEKYSKELSIYF